MSIYTVQSLETAPELSKPGLEQLRQAFGLIPNIAGVVANSPKLLNALVEVFRQVHSSSLSEAEIQIVLLTDAVANSSPYAVAFHTALAHNQAVSSGETDAIRSGGLPTDKRYRALSSLARTLIEKRGHLSEQEAASFFAAGFTEEQLLVVVAIIAASTITNYAANIAAPPLDDFASQNAWDAIPTAIPVAV